MKSCTSLEWCASKYEAESSDEPVGVQNNQDNENNNKSNKKHRSSNTQLPAIDFPLLVSFASWSPSGPEMAAVAAKKTQQDGRVFVFTFFLCKHKKSPKSLRADAALDLRALWKGMKTRGRIPTLAEGVAAGLQSGARALHDITECKLWVFQPTRSEKWSNYKEVKDGLSSFLGLSNPMFVKLLNSAFKSKFQNTGSAELELV